VLLFLCGRRKSFLLEILRRDSVSGSLLRNFCLMRNRYRLQDIFLKIIISEENNRKKKNRNCNEDQCREEKIISQFFVTRLEYSVYGPDGKKGKNATRGKTQTGDSGSFVDIGPMCITGNFQGSDDHQAET